MYMYVLIYDNVRNDVVHLIEEWRRDGENKKHEFKEKNLRAPHLEVVSYA